MIGQAHYPIGLDSFFPLVAMVFTDFPRNWKDGPSFHWFGGGDTFIWRAAFQQVVGVDWGFGGQGPDAAVSSAAQHQVEREEVRFNVESPHSTPHLENLQFQVEYQSALINQQFFHLKRQIHVEVESSRGYLGITSNAARNPSFFWVMQACNTKL